ncbi:two-component sensor histidine kinase [Fertoebacter nigrum]|uniref:histidine kinase n=1 Tax=Fertoeibacter niger TaxID=2656921 RepID=A0A8X8GZI5_9RHOB|nr:ATP-binding protein [Fertoeibacter niger]NUB43367.1 two-component sensor histidine kinase [Fertoeibacter niger]
MESQLVGTVLAGVPLPLVLIDRAERIAAANAPALALFGPGIVGRHYIIAMRQPGLLDAIEGTLRHRQPGQARHVITGPSREVTYRVTISPVAGEGQAGALCAFEDITEQEQMGQIRRDFVANVSHELRTPLTALLGFIETLQGAARDDPAARGRFLGIMAREAERMNRLVRDLLSLSRVESEERVRPTERIDIVALIGMAVTALRPVADAAGVVIEVEGEEGPLVIPADPDQLTQVFHNLIENAVKYGAPGKLVTVSITRQLRDQARLGPSVAIAVTDRGEGIDPIHLPRLTERFYRVDSHRSREKGGTGLGLAIVKHIVNRHRGRFRIDSDLGRGSTFTVVLPEG